MAWTDVVALGPATPGMGPRPAADRGGGAPCGHHRDAAWALGDEGRRGHLAPGTLGDVTILSGDVLDATPDDIRAMEVIATIVGGEMASCADPDVCG